MNSKQDNLSVLFRSGFFLLFTTGSSDDQENNRNNKKQDDQFGKVTESVHWFDGLLPVFCLDHTVSVKAL